MKKSSSDLTTGSVAKQLLMFGHTAHSSGTDASRQRWRRYDTYHDASLLYAVSQSDFCQYRPRLWKIHIYYGYPVGWTCAALFVFLYYFFTIHRKYNKQAKNMAGFHCH